LSYVAACKELTDWRSRFEWLAEQPSTPQQQVLRDLYRAIAAFFNKSNPVGRPRFKSRKAGYATARWTKCGFAVSGSGLGLPDDRLEVGTSAGRIRLRVVWSRPLPSPPSSVTVYRDPAGRWWASFVVRIEAPAQPLPLTGQATGLDLGLATFATTCDAESDIPNPRLARAQAKALARSQRKSARTRQGSAHRARARRCRARIEAKTAAQRVDFHHKAARGLVGAYDRIGVENLAIRHLSRRGRGKRKTGLTARLLMPAGVGSCRYWPGRPPRPASRSWCFPGGAPPRIARRVGRTPSPAWNSRIGCSLARTADLSWHGTATQPATCTRTIPGITGWAVPVRAMTARRPLVSRGDRGSLSPRIPRR
jgi:transposase